jgi:succinyl-diaminopimelate desuccinylase
MQDPISMLRKLVALPTVTDDIAINDKALDYLEHFFGSRGLYCIRQRFDGHGTLVASSRPDNAKNPTVLLAAHIDVVSGSEKALHLIEKNGKLIGRGVYDMKFSIAGYMQLVEELKNTLQQYDFAIMITTDEEYGGRDGINGVEKLVQAGYLPKVCILPDSTAPGWDIERLAKGVWRFDITATGKQTHGSRPWEGESASFKLLPALHEIQARFADQAPHTDTLNIALVHGGETYNLLPAAMTAGLEIRFMSDTSQAALSDFIQDVCTRHGLHFEERSFLSTVITNLNDPFVATYADCVQQVTGRRPEGFVSFAASDSPYFVQAGIPCIVSCCLGGKHHSPDEWIDKESFLQFTPILRAYLEQTALTTAVAPEVDTQASVV